MNKSQNTRYMLRQWLLPAVVAVAAALFLGSQLLQGKYLTVTIVAVLVAAAAGWTVYAPALQERKLLRSAAPEPLLAHFEHKFAQAPIADRDAALAYSKAAVYSLYGRFADARAAVAGIDWRTRAPLIQAQKTLLEAWWSYLAQPDPARGLALAQQARQLAEVSFAFPSAGLPQGAYDAAIELGQLLTGAAPGLAANLEARLPRQPLLLKALLAWGLVNYYQRTAQPNDAERMRLRLTEIAPHCAGLA